MEVVGALADDEGKGDITADELGQVMRELGLNPTENELKDLVNEADVNNDGVISFEGGFTRTLASLKQSPVFKALESHTCMFLG